jgi:hypothetical protein
VALELKQFEELWAALEEEFAVAPSTTSSASSKTTVLSNAIENDPIAKFLIDNEHVKSTERDGRLHIVCPFEDEHTGPSSDSATTYFPANTGGYVHGHFDCKHAHCEARTDAEFKDALGIPSEDSLDDFEDISHNDTNAAESLNATTEKTPTRFEVVPAADFINHPPQPWLIKQLLPQAVLGVIYGESASGKTFAALDIVGSVVMGTEWRGKRVQQGQAVYICAEDSGGFRSRVSAYLSHNDIDPADFHLGVIPDAPNFMQASDIKMVLAAIRAYGEVSVIVVDTFAQVMSGANENAGEDVGKALAHCRALHKHTGALVILIHHSGKDASKGARGWSGLRAAADVELEVIRAGDERVISVTKLKNAVDGAEYGFRLMPVPVGMDEDNEEIFSCVVEPTEATRASTKRKLVAKGENEHLAMSVLSDMVGMGGESVSFHELTEAMILQMPFDTISGKKDTRREQAMKAVTKLRSGDFITVNGDQISLKGELA